MKKSLRNLAIMLSFRMSTALWVAETQLVALGLVIARPFIDFLKESRILFLKKWAGWMEKDESISKIEVVPVLKPPNEWKVRPP